jgi:serine carboxypeptidase-like clade 2
MNIPADVKAWELCSDDLEYIVDINATLWIYPILKEKYRILVYSGTTDGAVPTLGTKQWINNLGWKITDPWRPYFV